MVQQIPNAPRGRESRQGRRKRRRRGECCAAAVAVAAVVALGGAGTAQANCTTVGSTTTCDTSAPNPFFNTVGFGFADNSRTVNILSGAILQTNFSFDASVQLGGSNTVINSGLFNVFTDESRGISVFDNNVSISNLGSIVVTGNESAGITVGDNNPDVSNAGTISVSGTDSNAIFMYGDNVVSNTGTITVTGGGDTGIFAAGSRNVVTNSVGGRIEASGSGSFGVIFGTETGESTPDEDVPSNSNQLINQGIIVSSGANGVAVGNAFGAERTTVTNSGTITASGSAGIAILGLDASTISNSGAIMASGANGGGLILGSDSVSISNTGTISASGANARAVGFADRNPLVNSGTISASGAGGTAVLAAGSTNTLTNNAGAVIQSTGAGGTAIAFGSSSTTPTGNTLNNLGTIAGSGTGSFALANVNGAGGTTVTNSGVIDGLINLSNAGNVLTSSGTIQVTSGSFANHQVQGTFSQTAAGVFVTRIAPTAAPPAPSTTASDRLAVTGTANLDGTLQLVVQPGLYAAVENYTVVSATTLNGAFATVTPISAFLVPSLSYPNNTALLTVTRVPFGSMSGATVNQQAVGSALEAGYAQLLAGDPTDSALLNFYQTLLQSQASQVGPFFDSLSGEAHTAFQSVGVAGAVGFQEQLLDRLRGAPGGTPLPLLSAGLVGAPLQFAQLSRGATDAASPAAAAPLEPVPRIWSPWAAGQGLSGRVDDQPGLSGFDYDMAGGAAGIDWRVSDQFLAGVALGYSRGTFTLNQRADSGTINSLRTAVYGRYADGPLRLSGVLDYAWNQYDSDRRVLALDGTAQQATAHYDGHEIGVAAEAGYRLDLGGTLVEPLAGLNFVSLHQDAFTEQGGGSFGLSSDGATFNSLRSTIGVRMARPIPLGDGIVVTPEARARWGHEFLDEQPMLDTRLISVPGGSIAVRGAGLGRDAALLGGGITAAIGTNMALFVNYDAELRDGLTSHAVTGGLRLLTGPAAESSDGDQAGHGGSGAGQGGGNDGPRPWNLVLRSYVEYDSNIPQVTDAGGFPGDTGSVVFGASLYGNYHLYRDGVWEFGADGQIGTAQPVDDDVRDYAYTFIDPRLYVRRAFRLGGLPGRAGASYGFRLDWLRGHPYAHSHILEGEGVVNPTPDTEARLAYALSIDRFRDDGANPSVTSRDALQHRVDLGGAYTFDQGQRALRLTYEFRYNDAEGSNFTFASHGIRGRFSSALPYGTTGLLEAAYTSAGYTDFVTDPQRTNDIQEYRAALYFPITDNVTGDLSYGYTRAEADEPRFAFDRHRVALGITTRF